MYFSLLAYADLISANDFSVGNNSAIVQRASALASTYFLSQSSIPSGLSSGAIAGIVVSVIVVVLLLVAIIAVAGFALHSQRSKK